MASFAVRTLAAIGNSSTPSTAEAPWRPVGRVLSRRCQFGANPLCKPGEFVLGDGERSPGPAEHLASRVGGHQVHGGIRHVKSTREHDHAARADDLQDRRE
jgi:hypothetical protein